MLPIENNNDPGADVKKIEKVKLKNFKKFADFSVEMTYPRCILVGENEAGKSSILQAINLVLSGNRNQVESIGIERLLNANSVRQFMASAKAYADLPEMFIEIYFNDHGNPNLDGRNNSDGRSAHGLRLDCKPNTSLATEIRDILAQPDATFPYDYYETTFFSFNGEAYSGIRRPVRHLVIDTASVSAEYAMRDYISRMYEANALPVDRSKHEHEYRRAKDNFKTNSLNDLNQRMQGYQFALRTDTKSNLMADLTLMQDNVGIDSKGKGLQCFIKTAFALKRADNPNHAIDVILIEEPENHLSRTNVHRLLAEISLTDDKQLIIATHSNMLTARLDLRNAVMFHCPSAAAVRLADITEPTAKFFTKAPDHGILDFILSEKSLLVEGDAEHILMESFFVAVTGNKPAHYGVHILSVGGLTFKRYLEVSKILKKMVAVIRDNDGNYQRNCVELFEGCLYDNARVFSETDNALRTFEISVYQSNTVACDEIFRTVRGAHTTQEYMLENKTEAAYLLLDDGRGLTVPTYIRDAIEWLVA